MSLLSGANLLAASGETQLALPSFDVAGGNIDMLHAIGRELARSQTCAFLASTPASIQDYYGYRHFVSSIREMAAHYKVHVAAHLDHATSFEDIAAAIDAGCTSIMVDGSKLPLAANIELTKSVVKKSHRAGASVEAELGVIGGKEDECIAETAHAPSLKESMQFIDMTHIDFFAPAIGTSHGFYSGPPGIDWKLARDLGSSFKIPLVLHGGTGLSDDTVRKLIRMNFRKINYATGVRSCLLYTSPSPRD